MNVFKVAVLKKLGQVTAASIFEERAIAVIAANDVGKRTEVSVLPLHHNKLGGLNQSLKCSALPAL